MMNNMNMRKCSCGYYFLQLRRYSWWGPIITQPGDDINPPLLQIGSFMTSAELDEQYSDCMGYFIKEGYA
jgi:hypothetical protein